MIYLKWFTIGVSAIFVITVLNVVIYQHKTRREIKKGRKR
jgi:hypothetical protein